MSLKLLHLVIPMGVVCSSVIASATDSYIAQIATGLADGSSCANARGASYFNATTNWGAGATQIGPGTTVHLCGTISTQLTIQGSGSSASPLTVLWEPGAKISLPYCDNTNGCIKASGRSWVILNGNGTIPSIENTANGTALANHQDSVGVLANGPSCNSCEFKNLTISNLYVYVANSHDPHNFGVTGGFFLGGVSGSDFLKIHDNICHDVRACLSYNPTANDSGLQVYNNNFYNADGINIENNSASTPLIAATIHDNHFHDIANWDDAGCPYHHDGIHSWGLTGGTNAHIDFYNNLLDGNFGGCPTGAVFFEGIHTNTRFWNNVFATTFTQEQNGIVNIGSESLQFYNNTIIGANSSDICFVAEGGGTTGPTMIVENNLMLNCKTLLLTQESPVYTLWDYNIYAGCQPSGCNSSTPFVVNNVAFDTFAQWQAACSCDSHGQYNPSTSYAGVTSTGVIQSGSPGIKAGANLTGLNINALDSDTSAGNSRTPTPRPAGTCSAIGAAGCWTVGAYNPSGGSTPPSPPSSLSALVD